MNTNPDRYSRWEHLILNLLIIPLIWFRLLTLLLPWFETVFLPHSTTITETIRAHVLIWASAVMTATGIIHIAFYIIEAIIPDRSR